MITKLHLLNNDVILVTAVHLNYNNSNGVMEILHIKKSKRKKKNLNELNIFFVYYFVVKFFFMSFFSMRKQMQFLNND